MSLEPEPIPSPRIGDVERDDAVSLLQEHLAAGRIDNTEFNDRLNSALEARTMGDLVPLFHDLPGRRPGQAEPPTPAVPAAAPVTPADQERRRRIGGAIMAAMWPLAIITCFAVGWQYWWIMLIPIFFSGVIAQAFGLRGNHGPHRELGR